MTEEKKQYQQAFKATSLFGGVQFLLILVSMLRSKVVALFLGPAGMGVYYLLRVTVDVINKVSSFGLSASSVKYISQELTDGDEQRAYKLISVLQNLLWITGTFGAIVLALSASFISKLLFDSNAYVFSIIWLSIAVLFKQLADGRISILQSLRKLQYLAKASLWGSVLGLIIVTPIYYFLRDKGIVPAIIIAAAINLVLSNYFLRKSKIPKIKTGKKESLKEGLSMLKLGLALSFSSMISALTAYLLQLYINEFGGVAQVGLYSAGFMIIDRYGGMIFTAMAKDYYPRLAGVSKDNKQVREMVNHQAFIALLLMTPFVVIFLALAPQFITLLLSAEFNGIKQMASYGVIALLFKATSWAMAYIIIAKGDTKLYIQTNISFLFLGLFFNIIGYHFGGLTGLGISFLVYYIIYFLGIYLIAKKRYEFSFTKDFHPIFIVCAALGFSTFGLTYISNPFWRYSSLFLIIVGSTWFCYYELNKRVDFKSFIREFLDKRKSNKD